jgi:hypothetical protein
VQDQQLPPALQLIIRITTTGHAKHEAAVKETNGFMKL